MQLGCAESKCVINHARSKWCVATCLSHLTVASLLSKLADSVLATFLAADLFQQSRDPASYLGTL